LGGYFQLDTWNGKRKEMDESTVENALTSWAMVSMT